MSDIGGGSEKKILKVNPNDFLVSSAGRRSATTRKKSPGEPKEPKKIKVKDKDTVSKTVKKQLVKHLREQQKLNYDKLLSGSTASGDAASVDDFEGAVQSMAALLEPPAAPAKIPVIGANYTFKRHHAYPGVEAYMTPAPIKQMTPKISPPLLPSPALLPSTQLLQPSPALLPSTQLLQPSSPMIPTLSAMPMLNQPQIQCTEQISELPMLISPRQPEPNPTISQQMCESTPKWGCLKGGQLPTYRTFHGTMKNTQRPKPVLELEPVSANPFLGIGGAREEIIKQMSEKFQMGTVLENRGGAINHPNQIRKPKIKKQRKVVRRTYRLGKSKVFPRVSVLVSNKTVRKEINDKIHAIKETPMHEVRNYLVKNGFIKIGSSAPNDVLRRMYENLKIVNGDVKNHNTETLLYNFLKSDET
jgi:hypothetical protein